MCDVKLSNVKLSECERVLVCVCENESECERAGVSVSGLKWGASGMKESVINYFMLDINYTIIELVSLSV